MTVHCPVCDAENPEGARFCTECGAPIREAAIGSTERLPDATSGKRCASCGVNNLPNASFCVNCGRSLEAPAGAPRPVAIPASPVTTIPPEPTPLAPLPRSNGQSWPVGRPNPALWGSISGGVFLIGLAVLFATGWWWPGILVLVGLMTLFGSVIGGQPRSGIAGAFWILGIAVLAATGWWWPGILVLVGISAIFGGVLGRRSWRS